MRVGIIFVFTDFHRKGGKYRGVLQPLIGPLVAGLLPGDIEARCPEDGMIEAIRRREGSYVAGVQWHPEFHDPDDPAHFDDGPILRHFLAAARAARQG